MKYVLTILILFIGTNVFAKDYNVYYPNTCNLVNASFTHAYGPVFRIQVFCKDVNQYHTFSSFFPKVGIFDSIELMNFKYIPTTIEGRIKVDEVK